MSMSCVPEPRVSAAKLRNPLTSSNPHIVEELGVPADLSQTQ
jgi:hypothetical protein